MSEQDLEKQYKELQSNLKETNDKLKAHAENAEKLAKEHKEISAESKATVDQLLNKQTEFGAQLKELEQTLADGGKTSTGKPQTVGEEFVGAEAFDENMERLRNQGGSYGINISAAITSANDSAGATIEPDRVPGIVMPGQQRLTIRDLLNWGRTSKDAVRYVRESGYTNNADVVSENPTNDKPESALSFDMTDANVATIAHLVRASKQVLDDSAMLTSYIDGRLQYGLKLKEEAQLLKGTGLDLNVKGIYTQASDYSNPGVDVTDDTVLDRLRLALLQVTLAEYDADAIVLNPIEWTNIELTKDSQGRYIFAQPQNSAQPRLWSKPVVATQSMGADEFLVGNFAMGAQGWDREDVNVQISTEDKDNFSKNMVTIRCEERIALTVFRPEAFVKGPTTIGSGGA